MGRPRVVIKRGSTTLRQHVSLTICVSVTLGVVVLNVLFPAGHWAFPISTAPAPGQRVRQDLFTGHLCNNESGGGEEKGPDQARGLRAPAGVVGVLGSSSSSASRQEGCPPSRASSVPVDFSPEELGLENVSKAVPQLKEEKRIRTRKRSPQLNARIAAVLKSRNPCWRDERKPAGLVCLPYYYLAGFPKCGSTDLFRRLSLHPHIARVTNLDKEPHWITRKRFTTEYRSANDLDSYKARFGRMLVFSNKSVRHMPSVIIGDHSASTMWDNHLWQHIPANRHCTTPRVVNADVVRHLNRHAKIVVIVRNPTDRLYSDHLYFNGHSTKELFHQFVVNAVREAIQCFAANGTRQCVYSTFNDLLPRLHVGLYSVHIADWLQRFPRDQLHVVRLEDMMVDRKGVMQKVFSFLGVEAPDEATTEAILRKPVARAGRRREELGPMLAETRVLLDHFYRPFNAQLARLLKDSKFQWSDDVRKS